MLRRSARQLCTASNANSSLKTAVAEVWDAIIDAEWVDNEEPIKEIAEAESVIDRYRAVYDGTQDDLYEEMRTLYQAKEAAKLVALYEQHIFDVAKEHDSQKGMLGDQVEIPEGAEKPALDTLREYSEFVNAIENDRVARKVEAQLGRKIIQLRQVLSIHNFSAHFSPMAGDSLVVDKRNSRS